MIQGRKFRRAFKLEAMKDRGVSAPQVAHEPDVHESVLRKWMKEFASDPVHAFPRHSRAAGDRAVAAKGHPAEVRAGHPKRGCSLLREETGLKFVFIAKHRADLWHAAGRRDLTVRGNMHSDPMETEQK